MLLFSSRSFRVVCSGVVVCVRQLRGLFQAFILFCFLVIRRGADFRKQLWRRIHFQKPDATVAPSVGSGLVLSWSLGVDVKIAGQGFLDFGEWLVGQLGGFDGVCVAEFGELPRGQ